ncbi:5,6-dimethylbenzimidazole synthase [Dongia sedimenti]|uniref:5,6-dimethylbenzimidazole synthase n=1 Tax=Dongia sedimenti TaxID=3064282 RepID=A0ABU0YTB8_9PROT|nr:5,6-dimethylbenzimidazole synthase [Rhodospirillaceae bacterium R-7]
MSTAPLYRAAPTPRHRGFGHPFQAELAELLAWRRDVRHFRTDPVPEAVVDRLLDLACLAPSVGNSQPWRFVDVASVARRGAIIANYQTANAEALGGYRGERAALYASLKLSGLQEAPVHIAVFCDETTGQGLGLGRRTMPETLRYSAVIAVHTLWLAARARGLGLGWVSILDPAAVPQALDVPPDWSFVAYLCLGWPVEDQEQPELQQRGWQSREAACRQLLRR